MHIIYTNNFEFQTVVESKSLSWKTIINIKIVGIHVLIKSASHKLLTNALSVYIYEIP